MKNSQADIVVTLSPSGRQFNAQPNTSVLESGLSAGIALPYSCTDGRCGDCRAKIIAGELRKIRFHDFALSESEKISGVCLLCANTADSDLTIEVTEAQAVEDIPHQQLRGKLCHLDYLPGVMVARFKISRGKAFRFLPGQYAKVTLPEREPKLLPIANCPCESRYLEFHLPTVYGDEYHAVKNLGRSERVIFEGPTGVFTWRDNEPLKARPNTLFITTGYSFAALKPVIEHVISNDREDPCWLIWIATEQVGQYHHNLCRSWADAFDWFSYVPIADNDCLKAELDRLDLKSTKTYISANSAATNLSIEKLVSAGIPSDLIIVDDTVR